jgi:hypothetical protein
VPTAAHRHPQPPRPPLWLRTSVPTGLLLQLTATAVGSTAIGLATGLGGQPTPARPVELVLGLLLVYLDTHALGHVLVGRAVGIDFRGFGLRGTDHPAGYPPVLRQVMSVVPMWTAITDPASRRAAPPRALAAMYAAGETTTTLCTVGAAAAAFAFGAPGGSTALVVAVIWNAIASVAVTFNERGDYRKALTALAARPARSGTDHPTRQPPGAGAGTVAAVHEQLTPGAEGTVV